MEYVPGARTLADHARRERLLPMAQVVKIMRDCAMAFDYAHSKGVVHRDIQPTNIMLDGEGNAKIGDFGVALIDRADVEETQVIGRLGSPRYMAPEQLSAGEVDNQSDIYSLGVVIYELLTGVSPFAGRHVGDIARKVLKEPHRPIRELNPEVSARLADIIDRTLKKHPAGRYRTAMELAGELGLVYEELAFSDHRRSGPEAIRDLEQLPCFYGFETADLAELLAVAVWEDYGVDERLVVEGRGDASALVLIRGMVQVVSGVTRVGRLGAGDTFGDFGLVESGDLGAELVAVEACTVLRIDAGDMARLSPSCAMRVYRLVASGYAARLQQLQRRITRRTG
jgi:CRP-like cAMP-binding protein